MRPFFLYGEQQLFIPGSVQGAILFVHVSVTFVLFFYCKSWTSPISTNTPGIYRSGGVWANAWDGFRRAPSRDGRGRPAAVDFVVCFGCGGISFLFLFVFFLRMHKACCKDEAALSHFPLY